MQILDLWICVLGKIERTKSIRLWVIGQDERRTYGWTAWGTCTRNNAYNIVYITDIIHIIYLGKGHAKFYARTEYSYVRLCTTQI